MIFFRFLLSFSFDWEDISDITSRIFNSLFAVSVNVVKHGLFVFDIFHPVKVKLVLRVLLR